MGLLYILPVTDDEGDRTLVKDGKLILKSYGLPMIFWGYLAGVLCIIFAMSIGVKDPLLKLYATQDPINQAISIGAFSTIIILPISLIFFFFYEKRIHKEQNQLKIGHYLFGVPFYRRSMQLKKHDALEVEHFMDSPNLAKMNNDPELRGFQNKGYFELFAYLENGKKVMVDRSSRKADLKKLKVLLSRY